MPFGAWRMRRTASFRDVIPSDSKTTRLKKNKNLVVTRLDLDEFPYTCREVTSPKWDFLIGIDDLTNLRFVYPLYLYHRFEGLVRLWLILGQLDPTGQRRSMPAKWNWIFFFVRSSVGGAEKTPAAKRSSTEVGGSWRSSDGSIGHCFRFEFGTQIGLFSEQSWLLVSGSRDSLRSLV